MMDFGVTSKNPSRIRSWLERVAYAFMIGITTIAVAFAFSIVFRSYFDHPPIDVKPLSQPPNRPICANHTYEALVRVTSKKTTLISFYLVVRDEKNNHYVDPAQIPLFQIPTEEGIMFTQRLPWKVPDLPPGDYIRILAIRGHDLEQTPLVFTEPFSIGEECDE